MGLNMTGAQERQVKDGKGGRQPEQDEFVAVPGTTYNIRILPSNIDEYDSGQAVDFAYKHQSHYLYHKADGSKIYGTLCPKSAEPHTAQCAMCEESNRLFNSANPQDKAIGKQMYRTDKRLINILDLSSEESYKKGVQWWVAPISVYNDVRKYILNPQWGQNGNDMLAITAGRQFTIEVQTKEASGSGYVKYVVAIGPELLDITPYLAVNPTWRDKINSLESHVPTITSEEIQAIVAVIPTVPVPDNTGVNPTPPASEVTPPLATGATPLPPVSIPIVPDSTPIVPDSTPIVPDSTLEVLPPKKEPIAESASSCDGFGTKYAPQEQKCKDCKVNNSAYSISCRTKYLE